MTEEISCCYRLNWVPMMVNNECFIHYRLISDFLYFGHKHTKVPAVFDRLVQEGVRQLNECFMKFSRNVCIYRAVPGGFRSGVVWTPQVMVCLVVAMCYNMLPYLNNNRDRVCNRKVCDRAYVT